MKVSELVKLLNQHPADANVALEMSEAQAAGDGFSSIDHLRLQRMKSKRITSYSGGDFQHAPTGKIGVVISACFEE